MHALPPFQEIFAENAVAVALLIGLIGMRFAGPKRYSIALPLSFTFGLVVLTYAAATNWLGLFTTHNATFPMQALAISLLSITVHLWLLSTLALVAWSAQLTATFSKLWVKALDFPYLVLASFALVRILNASPIVRERLELLDNFGFFLVSAAIAIRLTKSTIEVFFDPWYNH